MAWSLLNELGRKAIHLLTLLVLVGYVALKDRYSSQIALMAIIGLLMLFLIIEYLRLELNIEIPFFYKFIRPKESQRMIGSVYLLSAVIICLAVFDFKIALAAILMTIIGDIVAALVGKKFGVTLIFRDKTIIGTFSELVTNLIISFVVLLSYTNNIYIPLIMAFTATITETLADELDDNLLTPLFSGFIGQLLFFIL